MRSDLVGWHDPQLADRGCGGAGDHVGDAVGDVVGGEDLGLLVDGVDHLVAGEGTRAAASSRFLFADCVPRVSTRTWSSPPWAVSGVSSMLSRRRARPGRRGLVRHWPEVEGHASALHRPDAPPGWAGPSDPPCCWRHDEEPPHRSSYGVTAPWAHRGHRARRSRRRRALARPRAGAQPRHTRVITEPSVSHRTDAGHPILLRLTVYHGRRP